MKATSLILAAAAASAVAVGASRVLLEYSLARESSSAHRKVAKSGGADPQQSSALIQRQRALFREAREWLKTSNTQRCHLTSWDGLRLDGLYLPAEGSHRWALLVHGYKDNRGGMASYARVYADRGYQILMPDNRACGESEGRYLGMGWLDRLDLIFWIRWIIRKDPQAEIVLHGVSMGAAAVMMTAGEPLPPQVKAVVEDCGYTTVEAIMASELTKRFPLPAWPLTPIASRLSEKVAGYRWHEASALEKVKHTKLPILFIHGEEDDFVPVEMAKELYAAAPEPRQLCLIPGAGHAQASTADPQRYWDTVFQFLDGILTSHD